MDRDPDLRLVDVDLHGKVKAYFFMKIFEVSTQSDVDKPSASDFIKYINKNILPNDLNIDTSLVKVELQTIDLAKKVRNYEQQKRQFEASLEEANSLIGTPGSQSLPF